MTQNDQKVQNRVMAGKAFQSKERARTFGIKSSKIEHTVLSSQKTFFKVVR